MSFLFISAVLLLLGTVVFNFIGRKTKENKFFTMAIISGGFGLIPAVLGFLISAGYLDI